MIDNKTKETVNITASLHASLKEEILSEKNVTWYHASNLDGRPIMALRALMNWNFWTEEENVKLQNIGRELKNTTLVYSENSRNVYEKLLGACKHASDGSNESRIRLFNGVDGSLLSITPISIFTEGERKKYLQIYNDYSTSDTSNRDYDGFIINIQWFKTMPDIIDTIVFFCLDDFYVKEIFDAIGVKVVAFFEHDAGHEGSPGFTDYYKTDEDAKTIKYLFTNGYNYCKDLGYILCNSDYKTIWSSFEVMNFLSGREKMTVMPVLLPEHAPENNQGINGYCEKCKKDEYGYCRTGNTVLPDGNGFCLAIRKKIMNKCAVV